MKDSAPADDVYIFECKNGPGPDLDDLAFDLTCGYGSPLNSAIIELLLRDFQQTCIDESWPIQKQDNYVREVLKNWYKKLRTMWLKGQPRISQGGILEAPDEVEAWLVDKMDRQGKASRQCTHQRNVCHPIYVQSLMPIGLFFLEICSLSDNSQTCRIAQA